jgi:hypothetical protein
MAQRVSNTTTDHETIRQWTEERGGSPAAVEGTSRGEGDPGMIRIDFPGYSGEGKLRPISWDEWFGKFDASGLALVYEDTTARGQRSNFNKLVARETALARAAGRRTSRRPERARGTARKASARKTSARSRGRAQARGTRAGGRRAAAKRGGRRAASTRGAGRRRAGRAEAARTTSRRGTSRRGATSRGRSSRAGTSRRGSSRRGSSRSSRRGR